MFIADGKKAPRTGLWNSFRAACVAAGMTARQTGDAEGAFSFDPEDDRQAKVAIKVIRARTKRRMTPESLERLAIMRQSLQKPLVEAVS